MTRPVASLFCILLLTASAADADSSFYTELLSRGIASVRASNYDAATNELRIAAFGLMDDIAAYQTAEVYFAVASTKLGRSDAAHLAVSRVLRAERVHPAFASLSLDPDVRRIFLGLPDAGELLTTPALPPARGAGAPKTPAWTHSPDDRPTLPEPARSDAGQPRQDPLPATQSTSEPRAGRAVAPLQQRSPARQPPSPVVIAQPEQQPRDSPQPPAPAPKLASIQPPATNAPKGAAPAPGTRARALPSPASSTQQMTVPASPVLPDTTLARTAPRAPVKVSGAGAPSGSAPGVSPLAAAARRSQLQATSPPPGSPAAATNAAADRAIAAAFLLLDEGRIPEARAACSAVARTPGLTRAQLLVIGRGLTHASAWRESLAVYDRILPFQKGEEIHMFSAAVDAFEIGNFDLARTLLAPALPALPETREVAIYRERIRNGR